MFSLVKGERIVRSMPTALYTFNNTKGIIQVPQASTRDQQKKGDF